MRLRHTTLGVGAVLRALGVKGGDLPQLDTRSYQPVLVMGNFASTLTAEPVEARGMCGEYIAGLGGKYGVLEFAAVAPGGVIIERFWGSNDEMLVGTFNAGGFVTNFPTNSYIAHVGGIDTRSIVTWGWRNLPLANAIYWPFNATMYHTAGNDLRIYVAPGEFFAISNVHADRSSYMGLMFRELPEQIGSP